MFRLFLWLLQTLRIYWLQLLAVFSPRNSKCSFLVDNFKQTIAVESVKRKSSQHVSLPFEDIPTPGGWPIVGTLFDLIAAGGAPKLHKYIDSRHQELGSIFRERLGGTQDAVFVASASLMRSVFMHEGQYPKHPLPEAWTLYNREHRCQRGLFFMDGAEWLQNRRILNRFLLNGNMNWINVHIENSTKRLITAWCTQTAKNSNEFIVIEDLEQQLYRWAIEVICSVMFGAMSAVTIELEAALDEFSTIVHKIFESSALLMNFPPKIAKLLNLRMWQDFELNVSNVLAKGSRIVDMYIDLNNAVESQDTTQDSECLFSKLQDVGMPLDMIKRIFVDLVIAAGDTTAYSSQWALYLLSQDAELQQRIAKETDFCVDDRAVHSTVRGLIKETLRLYPVAPFIGRYLANDAVLGDFCIKKNTLLLLSLYTAGRDAEHFPNPTAVKPDRWQRDEQTGELQEVLQAHGSMPFAIGNRSCIGRKIAAAQMETLITTISCNFELKCLNKQPLDCILRLVTVPNQKLQLGIKKRVKNIYV